MNIVKSYVLVFAFAIVSGYGNSTYAGIINQRGDTNPSFVKVECDMSAITKINDKNVSDEKVKLEVSIHPAEGWMNGGYGSLKFKFINQSGEEIKTGKVTGEWFVDDNHYNNWDWEPNIVLSDKLEKTSNMIAWMPPKTEHLAKNTIPQIRGNAIVFIGNSEIAIPYSIEIPVAKLSSPIVSKKGRYIELQLQEKTWANVKNPDRVTTYIDNFYSAMLDLTGNRPYNGDMLALKECPRNPYFAYAGNPIVLNSEYVPQSVARFDNNEVDFGWVHEMGHDFDDEIGHYYNYGTFTEFQANIKLSYALEMLCTENSTLKIKSWVDKKTMQTGVAFNDEYFAPAGDKYLADKERSWETLSSDDYHALFHSVIRKHGWDVMKKYYRTFGKLRKKGITPPKGIERIYLSLAVLDNCCEEDLAPLYKKWRIPADRKKLKEMEKKYQLGVI